MQDDYIVYIIKAKSFPTTGRINETNITDRYSAQIEILFLSTVLKPEQ